MWARGAAISNSGLPGSNIAPRQPAERGQQRQKLPVMAYLEGCVPRINQGGM